MSLQRSAPLRRKAMKKSAPVRDWSEALDKVEEEGICRVCRTPGGYSDDGEIIRLEAAHTIGREHDELVVGLKGGETLVVKRESIVPLCTNCHRAFDARRLDLLPFLFLPEQIQAVRDAGGIVNANRRLSGAR